MANSNEALAMRVSWLTILGNVLLSAFKLLAGLLGHSAAMLSDAVHSLSDVFSTFIVMIGIKLAVKEADKEHPYGHERFECVAALLLAFMLGATGMGIGYGGVRRIISGDYASLPLPGLIALVAALLSIAVKEGMYWYTRHAAKKIDSAALLADAWHHRSDAFSSVGSLIGIAGARLGFPMLDSLACIVICLFIVKAALDIFRDAVGKMTDRACDDAIVAEIEALILAQDKVSDIDLLQTRQFGNKIYVDVEIGVDGEAPLKDGHAIAHDVHDAIESHFPQVKHCMVHINPR